MDERRDEYGFCPKCGAVMQNGVCTSCGRGKRTEASFDAGGTRQGAPVRKKSSGNKLVIVLVVVLLTLFAIFIGLTIRAVLAKKDSSSRIEIDGDDFGYYDDYDYGSWYDDYDYDDDYEEYKPSPDDDYYEEFVDATVSGLSYEIEWNYISLYPDDEDASEYYSCTCPLILDGDEERMEKVNDVIRSVVCRHQEAYRDYAYGVESTAYVAYMGEDMLSLVVQNELYGRDDHEYSVSAVTVDMETGEVVPYEEMVQPDMELARRFREQDEYQNGGYDYRKGFTDEEILEYLQDEDSRVAFYTPVGLEVGFNYEDGWVTVTLKDKAL